MYQSLVIYSRQLNHSATGRRRAAYQYSTPDYQYPTPSFVCSIDYISKYPIVLDSLTGIFDHLGILMIRNNFENAVGHSYLISHQIVCINTEPMFNFLFFAQKVFLAVSFTFFLNAFGN